MFNTRNFLLLLLLSPAGCTATFVLITSLASYLLQHRTKSNIHFPPPTKIHTLQVIIKEWIAATIWIYGNLASRICPWLFKLSPGPAFQQGTPIFMMPGYLDTPYNWRHCVNYLNQGKKGPIYPIYVLTLKSLFSRFLRLAKGFKEKLETDSNENACLLGFSMGGILAAFYNEFITQHPFKKVITIASPLHGTYLAHGVPGENAIEMRRDSPILKELRERMKRNVITQYYHIASQDDNIVLPWDSALLSPTNTQNNRQFILTGFGHATLLRSKEMASVVQKCLEDEPNTPHIRT